MPNQPDLSVGELETAFESIGEGAVIIDASGRIIRVNQIALDLLAYTREDLIGQWFLAKIKALNIDQKEINPINLPVVQAVLTGQPVYEYMHYQGNNPVSLPVFISASPMIKDSQPIGAMIIFRDISIEEAVDQMKSEFISLASHQLRTPLTSIKTYSHMLIEGYMGKISREMLPALRIIVSSTNRMNELISTLLNITRLESGAIAVQKDNVDIKTLAKEVIEEMKIPAQNNAVVLKLITSGKYSPKIKSDGPIIKEIIANLVSNSVKYSRDNGKVTISVRSNPTNISITVKDNGLGIPARAQGQIFSKFFRAHNAIERETNGTGLGLYLVKGLVEELGGSISFTSKEGQGTAFKVQLPKQVDVKK